MNIPQEAIKDHQFVCILGIVGFAFARTIRYRCKNCNILCLVPKDFGNVMYYSQWCEDILKYKFWYCIEEPYMTYWDKVPSLYNLSCDEIRIRDIIL